MISAKTLAEMETGARALAEQQGRTVPQDLLQRLENTAERNQALRRWEREGKLMIERRSEIDDLNCGRTRFNHRILHHVKDGPTFEEDPAVSAAGGYPSELLTAQIALAIQAIGGGNG